MNREESIRFAAKYLEDLLSFFGINVAVDSTMDEEVIQLSVPSTSLNPLLIGKDAKNLRALQHVVMMALEARDAEVTRVNVDVADYKAKHNEILSRRAEGWIKKVRETGQTMRLEDLKPAERRVIHKLAEDYSDITTHSEGEGKERVLLIEKRPDLD
jgi:spoIIIJ-associated protein